jgi:hypothetical protein
MVGLRRVAADLAGPVADIIDDIYTSDEERAEQALRPVMAVHATNKAEADHASVFVAGWRPFIGWVLGVCLAYAFLVRDLIAWAFLAAGADLPELPTLDIGEIVALALSMLGLAGMRTGEKITGAARSRLYAVDSR